MELNKKILVFLKCWNAGLLTKKSFELKISTKTTTTKALFYFLAYEKYATSANQV